MQGTFKEHAEIAREVAAGAPYKEWVNSNHRLEEMVTTNQYLQETQMDSSQVLRLQAANGTSTYSCFVQIYLHVAYFTRAPLLGHPASEMLASTSIVNTETSRDVVAFVKV